MAKPIVDGIPEQTKDSVEVIHLNLLVAAGREAAGRGTAIGSLEVKLKESTPVFTPTLPLVYTFFISSY